MCSVFSFYYFVVDDVCHRSIRTASSGKCFVDKDQYFLKKEILHYTPEVIIVYDVFTAIEREQILQEVKRKRLLHMFEIYQEYLDDLTIDIDLFNYLAHGDTYFDTKDLQILAKTLHFGREGKLYFPDANSIESQLIETKLVKYGLLDNGPSKANLQVGKLQKHNIHNELYLDFNIWHGRLPHTTL